ncbi:MAG: PH domain-containing protein [Balneolaceae bacterium]|nr:PH domain-containing protein [Balneolaceae bacterium]
MTNQARILATAEFNPDIKKYLLVFSILVSTATIAGILLIPFILVIAPILIRKYFDRLSCELTTRALRFEKGFIFHIERTIPLDKIQDLTFKEGPLLRAFGLSILKVETAGNTGQGTSDLTLIGIVDAAAFRQMVLEQRDVVTDNSLSAANSDSVEQGETAALLRDIRDTLGRIEKKI